MRKSALELYEEQLTRKKMNDLLQDAPYVKDKNLDPSKIVEETIKTIGETKNISEEEIRINAISEKVVEFLKPIPEKIEVNDEDETLEEIAWVLNDFTIKEKRAPLPLYAIEVTEKLMSSQSVEEVMRICNLKVSMLDNIVELVDKKLGKDVACDLIPSEVRREIKTKKLILENSVAVKVKEKEKTEGKQPLVKMIQKSA